MPEQRRNSVKPTAVCLVLAFSATAFAGGRGIPIQPDAQGTFEYADSFDTPNFLKEAFPGNLGVDSWQKGAITNSGPNRHRTLTYRFYGDRVIKGIHVRVDQRANGRHLGGRNYLYLSTNGLDWTRVGSTHDQKADRNGWQAAPLTVPQKHKADFTGKTELWVRAVLDNSSGLKTNTSNRLERLEVRLEVGPKALAAADPQAKKRQVWGRLRRQTGWRDITLDCEDPVDRRPPHYYEDCDGWLLKRGDNPVLSPDEAEGFPVQRAYTGSAKRSALSLAAFVRMGNVAGPLMAQVTVRGNKDSSRRMNVLWDGKLLQTSDTADYFESYKVFFLEIPGPHKAGIHEFRIAGGDCNPILVRRIILTGDRSLTWVEKPRLSGGSLEVLNAYYMPDPSPPADSQAVEGRHRKQDVGLIFPGMQRLYEEHADFGGLRVVARNNGDVPVRIRRMLLNGKPIEAHYVDFARSAWDARGVIWYRIRPRLLQPGQCGQIYLRFRRRPVGEFAGLTINSENADPVKLRIPYKDPGLAMDYVTTGKSMRNLYVYVRRTPGTQAGAPASLSVDGKRLSNVDVYGPDFPGNIALLVAKLPGPFAPSEYHVVAVTTDTGQTIAAQFRVLPFIFPRSSIHVPPGLCKPMHMNLAMWHEQSLETCLKHDLTTTSKKVLDVHPRVAYVMGPDEPDAKDNRGGGYDRGLGYTARKLAQSGWHELVVRYAPRAATWIIMNGTTRPLNWAVYGQLADVSCFDPYPVTYYGADHAYVRESLLTARQCGAPNRMFACLEAYGWRSGQGVPKGARGPVPAEYRQNVVQAIGAGTKGITSWTYAACAGGWQINEPAAGEIAKLNALIKNIESDLLLGTPIDLASSDAGLVPTGRVGEEKWPKDRVWVSSLLCGPDTIVVAAVNHIPASKPNPPNIEPARNVAITIRLPDFLRKVGAWEATENGLVPVRLTLGKGKAVLKLDSIESGRVFVLRRQ